MQSGNKQTYNCSLGRSDLFHPEESIRRNDYGGIVGLCDAGGDMGVTMGGSSSSSRRNSSSSTINQAPPSTSRDSTRTVDLTERSGQEWNRLLTPATGIRILSIDGWRQNIPPLVHQGVSTPPIQIKVGSHSFKVQPLDDGGIFFKNVAISLDEFADRIYDCTLEWKRPNSLPKGQSTNNTRTEFVQHVVTAIRNYLLSSKSL